MVGIEAILSRRISSSASRSDPPRQRRWRARITLSDFELASRLSYFLWSSMPDEDCCAPPSAARCAVRRCSTRRCGACCRTRRSSRFVENFGGQWLQFRGLESHQPDFYLVSRFDNYLRISMVQETRMFFENLIREDRSILEFLDADYTFVNEYLGQYYGLRDVKGPEFRKVSLASTPRRGILGQASMLTRLVVRQSDVGGAARQMGSRKSPECAAASAARRRAGSRRSQVGRRRHAAAAHGGASRQRDLRVVPFQDGPDRIRPGEFRRDRQLAEKDGKLADQRVGHPARWPHVQRPGRALTMLRGRRATPSRSA